MAKNMRRLLRWPLLPKYALLVTLTFAPAFALYHYGVRSVTPVRLLFGMGRRRAGDSKPVAEGVS